MFRRHAVLLVALLVVVAFLVDARLSGLSVTQPAQAQAKTAEARKWEYCTIVGANWDSQRRTSSATIGFITATGRRFETWDGGSSGDPMSIAFARLGSEGWEFVGKVAYNPQSELPDSWVFKRPAH